MEKSYFIYKSKIKEKIKIMQDHEKILDKVQASPNYQNLKHTINFLKRYLGDIKKEIKIDIEIICHG